MADEKTPDPGTPEVTIQPTLIDVPLPEYLGIEPAAMKTKITGMNDRLVTPHGTSSRVVAVVEFKVAGTGHELGADGSVEYHEKLEAVDLFEVYGEHGRRLISALRQSYRIGADAAVGQETLEVDAGVTDASGVRLTPEELAELKGQHGPDPVRAMLSPETSPVVAVYSDGARELWPDDYDPGEDRPTVGEIFTGNDGEETTVVELLDPATGETLDRFAPPDEPNPTPEELDSDDLIEEDIGGGIDLDADDPFEEAPLEEPSEEEGTPFDAGNADFDEAPSEDPHDVDPGIPQPEEEHFAFVDRNVGEIVEDLAVGGYAPAVLRLYIEAEKQGRGRGLKTRASALKALEAALAEISKLQSIDGGAS